MKRSLPALCLHALVAAGLMTAPAGALWEPDLRAGEEGRLRGQQREIYGIAISPDGKVLASASFDGTTRLWDTGSWKLIQELPGHAHGIGAVAISPAGSLLATGGLDSQVKIWELASGKEIATLRQSQKAVLSLAFSPDGRQLAVAGLDGVIQLYRTQSWESIAALKGHAGGISSLAYSPDGRWLASAGFNELGVRLWDPASGKLGHTLVDHSEEVYSLAFSPDGKYLASAGADKLIRLWSLQTLVPLARLAGHLKPIWSLAFTPDSQRLASGSVGDRTIRLWSVPQGANVQTLVKGAETTYSLAFAPGGKALYSGHNDASVRVWVDQPEDAAAAPAPTLSVALSSAGWRERSGGDGQPAAGEGGELLLSLENTGSEHLDYVTATVSIKTPGVLLQTAVPEFFISRFEAGSRKKLPLPVQLPAGLAVDALELEIRLQVRSPAGQSLLPLRVPLTRTP